eukprot:GHVU01096580.1.p9 GENE.GHVU01096580.1~~GHVU01096580.1.p9  ORF type:complete len:104 (-),score=3.88 GHVU01096580.1:1698-2009(-)
MCRVCPYMYVYTNLFVHMYVCYQVFNIIIMFSIVITANCGSHSPAITVVAEAGNEAAEGMPRGPTLPHVTDPGHRAAGAHGPTAEPSFTGLCSDPEASCPAPS